MKNSDPSISVKKTSKKNTSHKKDESCKVRIKNTEKRSSPRTKKTIEKNKTNPVKTPDNKQKSEEKKNQTSKKNSKNAQNKKNGSKKISSDKSRNEDIKKNNPSTKKNVEKIKTESAKTSDNRQKTKKIRKNQSSTNNTKSPKNNYKDNQNKKTPSKKINKEKPKFINGLIISEMEDINEVRVEDKQALQSIQSRIDKLNNQFDQIINKIDEIRENRPENEFDIILGNEIHDEYTELKESLTDRITQVENQFEELEKNGISNNERNSIHEDINNIFNDLWTLQTNVNDELYRTKKQKYIEYQKNKRIKQQEREYEEAEKEENRPEYENILNLCSKRRNDVQNKIKEYEDLLDKQEKVLTQEKNFYLRYRSMQHFIRQLEESIYKMNAYVIYLNEYEKCLTSSFNRYCNWSLLEKFNNSLPDNFPYIGRLYYFQKNDFQSKENYKEGNKYISHKVSLFSFENNTKKISGSVYDFEFNLLKDDIASPFMVSNIEERLFHNDDGTETVSTIVNLSLSLGKIKKAIQNNFPFTYRNNKFIQMQFSDGETEIKNKKVYAESYDYDLRKITVSYNKSAGITLKDFDNVIITFNNNERNDFKNFLIDNGYEKDSNEWFFRPKDKIITDLTEIIISNVHYAFIASFEKIYNENNCDFYVLRYKGLVNGCENNISNNEIFVSTNVSFEEIKSTSTFKGNSIEDIENNPLVYADQLESCSKFRSYLIDEFLTQKNMCITDFGMGRYLSQWNRILSDTINNSKKEIIVKNCESNDSGNTTIYVEDESILKNLNELTISEEYNELDSYNFLLQFEDSNFEYRCKIKIQNTLYYLETNRVIKNVSDKKAFLWSKNYLLPLKIQKYGLNRFIKNRSTVELIKDAIINPENINYIDNGMRINFFYNESILNNKYQEEAVRKAFSAKYFFIIQGPPGTGKTTVIKELILQQLLHNSSSKILITSQTNVAVDNVIRGLECFIKSKDGITESQVIRLGNTEENSKIADDLRKYSFEQQFNFFKKENDSTNILNETQIKEEFIKQFKVFGSTCVGLENKYYALHDIKFDLVIIDEAGKILPGEIVLPINKAKKVVIIGDHKQLPPVIDQSLPNLNELGSAQYISEQDRKFFYEQSIFERLFEKCPAESKTVLKIQFRMPPTICGLVNIFYSNKLENGKNCTDKRPIFLNHNLILIDMVNEKEYKEKIFLDTDGNNRSVPINVFEADALKKTIEIIRNKYAGRIVIITPYKKQKRLINKTLRNTFNNITIDTIDAFQGDEADVVIYCMTRAKIRTKYFSDDNRLNVAFSRAKNTLIIIGSSDYLNRYDEDKKIKQAYDYIKEYGLIIPYKNFIST